MANIYEEISKSHAQGGGKTDANIANDANHLGGVPAEQYATKKYVQDYHNNKEAAQKEYIDEQDTKTLQEAKEYINAQLRNQDFSTFAKLTDVQAVDEKLTQKIEECSNQCANNLATQIKAVVDDTNANFSDVNNAISNLNNNTNQLFQSVSDGKSKIAEAITDKGVATSANDSFDTMAGNIRSIQSGGGGEIDENFVNTSDATATPYDILSGKTAYTRNGKVQGILTIDENSGQPSYDIGAVEKVYASDTKTLKTSTNTIISNTKRNNTITYYNTPKGERHFEFDLQISGSNLKITNTFTQNTQLISFSELGLKALSSETDTEGTSTISSVADIDITPFSIKTTYLALLVLGTGQKYTLTLIPFSANGNDSTPNFIFDTSKSIYFYLNNLDASQSAIVGNYKPLTISHNGKYISVMMSTTTNGISGNTAPRIRIYEVDENSLSLTPLCNRRNANLDETPISFSTVNTKIAYQEKTIYVLTEDEKFVSTVLNNTVTEQTAGSYIKHAISEDGLHYVSLYENASTKKVNVEYGDIVCTFTTGAVTKNKIGSFELPLLISNDIKEGNTQYLNCRFMANSEILLVTYRNNSDTSTTVAYIVDFNSENILTPLADFQLTGVTLSDFDKYCYTNLLKLKERLIETDLDFTKVVALVYEGEYYYKQKAGILTAGQSDVRAGKTFIGWQGYAETGTMEVTE